MRFESLNQIFQLPIIRVLSPIHSFNIHVFSSSPFFLNYIIYLSQVPSVLAEFSNKDAVEVE